MQQYLPEGLMLHSAEQLPRYSQPELDRAQQEGTILEAIVTMCDAQHNLVVNLGSTTGLIPYEETAIGVAEGAVRDVAILSRVGRPVCFQVTNAAANPVLLSRRAAQLQARDALFAQRHTGDILPAIVTNPTRFGAFCDIGCGLPALLPIAGISVSRISHPSDRFVPGMDIFGVVSSLENNRICLSQRELLGTWEENAALFSQGETVAGIVRSVESYGIFVELTPNLAGLAEPREGVRVGQHAGVYIKSILPDKMKMKLVIIDSQEAPREIVPLRYFITQGHLDRWVYSPAGCPKVIETCFDAPAECPVS